MKGAAFPFRMALRELRRGRRKFVFFLLCIAIGVAGLVGVKGFNANLQGALLKEARTLMAADMSLTMGKPASEAQAAFLNQLRDRGIRVIRNVETVSMAVNAATKSFTLVEVKAVEPGYPFYGRLELDPAGELTDETALVGPELLDRLGLKVGDSLRLGKADYRISGVITKEPDRIAAGFSAGPRVMLTPGGLDKADLMGTGFRGRFIYLFKLVADEQVEGVRTELAAAFADDRPRIADFREANPTIRRFLDRMTSFLSLVSLVALLVGGMGVANATRAFVHQKLDAIAIMKCVGATNGRIVAVYLTQMLLLSIAGSILGVAIGFALQLLLPSVVGQYLELTVDIALSPAVAAQGLLVGVVTAVLFTLLPLSAIADVKPALVFRRDMAESQAPATWGQRLRTALLLAAIGTGLVLIAWWVSGSLKWGLYFMAGLVGAALLLGAASQFIVWLLRRIPVPRRMVILRQGVSSLYRPGSQVGAIILALGVGVTMVLAIYLLQQSLMREVTLTTPPGTPNMIFLNLAPDQAQTFGQFLRQQPGVIAAPDPTPIVRGRLLKVGGKTKEELQLTQEEERWFNFQFNTTFSHDIPEGNEVVAGTWWTQAEWKQEPLISVEREAAERLHLQVGALVEMDLEGGHHVTAKVQNIRRAVDFRAGNNYNFVFAPGILEDKASMYVAQASVNDEAAKAVQREVVVNYPGVTIIDIREMLKQVADLLGQIAMIIRFVAGFSVAAGLIILASSIATTKFRRTREAVLFKTLGATRSRVWRIFAVEYAILGLVAGLVGAGLSVAASWSMLTYVMDVKYLWSPLPLVIGVVLSVVLTVAVGVLSTLDVLAAKPLQVLRQD